LTADTPRARETLALTAPFEIVPRHLKLLRIVAPQAPQIQTIVPDRRLTGGLIVRASRISGPPRLA
jgi:hypothetical protein